jgi:diacylglycerol O-acyltransferase / wax synthase
MTHLDREELTLDDAAILRLESDAIKGHTGKALVVGPDANGRRLGTPELRARVAERLPGLPRLSQRVDIPRRGRPAWVDADAVDLDWHVAEADVAEPLDERGLRAFIGSVLAEKLDHERPLWRVDVAPMEGGSMALVGRIHHAMADGVSAIHIAGTLLFDEHADAAPDPPVSARNLKGARPPAVADAKPKGVRPLVGALRRELKPGADSVLDRHIGPEREVARAGVPLKRLKAIGKAAGDGVTVNDVVLAAVAGGLRDWLGPERIGGHGDIRVQIPVCLHLRGDGKEEIGNKDSFLNVDLPLHEPDPAVRLRTINRETSERKMDHDAETLYSFFHALGRFGPLHRGVTRIVSGPREFALSVSNVPGPREKPLILGRPVTGFVSFAEPADRHALRVSVISLGGDLAFGLCSDPNAIGGLDALAESIEASVDELEEAVR